MECNYDNFIEFLKNKGLTNPWEYVADLAEQTGEYYSLDAKYICEEDEAIIEEFNNEKNRKEEHKFITNILPAPFDGDIFNAKIFILTLNPGFKEEVNHHLYEILNDNARKEIAEYSIENLRLQGKKINPTVAVTFIGGRYWKNKTKEIIEKHGFKEEEIAIIQHIGYHSKEFCDSRKLEKLKSVEFIKALIEFIIVNRTDYCFILSRREKFWKDILAKFLKEDYNKRVIGLKNYRNTTISKGNITELGWDLIESIKNKKTLKP